MGGVAGFQERLRHLVGDKPIREVARKSGISEAALRKYLGGKSEPGISAAMMLSVTLDVPVGFLVAGEATRESEAVIPWYSEPSARLGAGRDKTPLFLSRSLADSIAARASVDRNDLTLFTAEDNAMAPGIRRGDLCVIARKKQVNGAVHLVKLEGKPLLRHAVLDMARQVRLSASPEASERIFPAIQAFWNPSSEAWDACERASLATIFPETDTGQNLPACKIIGPVVWRAGFLGDFAVG